MPPTRSPLRQYVGALLALAALAGLVVGIPAGLWHFVGWPLPHGVPSWSQVTTVLTRQGLSDELVIKTLALILWGAWLDLVVTVVLEVIAEVRGISIQPGTLRPFQPMVSALITAIVVAYLTATVRSTPAATTRTLAAQVATPAASAAQPATSDPRIPAAPTPPPGESYRVKSGDTLWDISKDRLGDPMRWKDVNRANHGRAEPNGRAFTNPNLIRPGWTLDLPSPTLSAPAPPAVPEGGAVGPSPSPPPPVKGTEPLPVSEAAPPVSPPARAAIHTTPRVRGTVHQSRAGTQVVRLPGGGVVGLSVASALTAALATARLHQRRRRRPGDPASARRVEALATPGVRRMRRAHLFATEGQIAWERGQNTSAAIGEADHAPVQRCRRHRRIALAEAAGLEVSVNLDDLNGIGLDGPGAADVARALVVAFLTTGAAGEAEVMLTGAGVGLIPGLDTVPGVKVVAELDEVLDRLEAEMVRRARILDAHGAADFAAMVGDDPAEPTAALLLVMGMSLAAHRTRVAALLEFGPRVGISIVGLGPDGNGRTVVVADDGRPTAGEGVLTLPPGARLLRLGEAEATEMVAVMAVGRGAELAARTGEVTPAVEALAERGTLIPSLGPADPASRTTAPMLHIAVLGPVRMEPPASEVLSDRQLELMALLAVYGQGITPAIAGDALWPDDDPGRQADNVEATVRSCRSVIREVTGHGAPCIRWAGDQYQLDPGLVTTDVWHLEKELLAAARTTDPQARRLALESATRFCAGELLAGTQYEWAPAAREVLRRRVVDALSELAELCHAAGDREMAVEAYERAIAVDEYCEELYRRLIRVQCELGRHDDARRAFRRLDGCLCHIGAEPATETRSLFRELEGQLGTGRVAARVIGEPNPPLRVVG